MTVRVEVQPDLLIWAVQRAGWPEEAIASKAPNLEKWLAGSKPTLKQLESFAHSTHVPLGYLFLSEPPEEELPVEDMRTLANREVRTPSANLLDTIYQCQSRQDWYREYLESHEAPEVGFVGSADPNSSAESIADHIRRLLSFELPDRSAIASQEDPRRYLIDRIEDCGVLVMVNGVVGSDTHRKLDPTEFRGFALVDKLAPLIFVNGADTRAAQLFTLIHEFAHVWLGGSALSDALMVQKSNNHAEIWCNKVAAEVLVPISSIRTEYRGSASLSEIERLARKYRSSTLVILKRLYDAHFLSWEQFDAAYRNERERILSAMASRRSTPGGNYYNTQPLRLSRRFARAVVNDTFEGRTSFREAYHLLGTKKHSTFENLANDLGAALCTWSTQISSSKQRIVTMPSISPQDFGPGWNAHSEIP